MATTSNTPQHISGRRIAGWVVQLGSFATTYACIAALKMPELQTFGLAVAIEGALYYAKKLAFLDGRDSVGWAAVLLDTLLNAGGIWPFAKLLNGTPTWIMIVEALGLNADLGPIAAFIISLALGFILSVLPHRLLTEE